jgi:hypothetical protein
MAEMRNQRGGSRKRSLYKVAGAPLKGGAITHAHKGMLAPGQFSVAQNVRSDHPGFKKRLGYVKQHATADGTNRVENLYHFYREKAQEEWVLAQMEDGDILKSATMPPGVDAGVFGPEIWSGTTSPNPGAFSKLSEKLIHSNGVDQHQIWTGETEDVGGFVVYKGSSDPTTLTGVLEDGEDYTNQVIDGQASTVAVLDSLAAASAGHGFFVYSATPAKSFTFTVAAANATEAGLKGYYWKNDSTWAEVSGLTDGTASGGATLAQTGTVSFTEPTDIQEKYLFGRVGYWYLFTPTPLVAADDLTGYTEVDSGSDISLTSTTATVSTMERVADSSVTKSYGASNFGNFVHRCEVTQNTVDDAGFAAVWLVSNTYFTWQDMIDNTEGIAVYLHRTGSAYRIGVSDHEVTTNDFFNVGSAQTRYLEMERKGSTFTVKIYTDSGFTTLEDTLSITCGTTAYEYHGVVASRDAAGVQENSYTSGNHKFNSTLDSEVEISAVTYDSSFAPLKNLWDGAPIFAAEVQVEGTTQWETFGASAVDIGSLASGKKIVMTFSDPQEALYFSVGGVPNATGTAITSLKYWNGSAWTTVGTVVDGTSGLSNTGWMTFARPSDEQPRQFGTSVIYGYSYELIFDSNLSASMVIGVEGQPYFDITDMGYVGQSSSSWKNRAVYSFTDKFPEYVYISGNGGPQILSAGDTGIIELGDGRSHKVAAMRPYNNELMVWQEEKGSIGGTLTLIQGYNQATFGKVVLSDRLGTMNNKSVDIIEDFTFKTKTHEMIKKAAFCLSREGVYMCDGSRISFIDHDIHNYFEPGSAQCIRRGYEKLMWLRHDPSERVVRLGLVSGSSATEVNVWPVFDLEEGVWYFDDYPNEMACFENVGAPTGDIPVVQIAGGVDDGTVYNMNTGQNDISAAINSIIDIELHNGGEHILLEWLSLTCQSQAAGNITLVTYRNGIQKDSVSLPMTAAFSTEIIRRNLRRLAVESEHITVRLQHNTTSQNCAMQHLGMEVYAWDRR